MSLCEVMSDYGRLEGKYLLQYHGSIVAFHIFQKDLIFFHSLIMTVYPYVRHEDMQKGCRCGCTHFQARKQTEASDQLNAPAASPPRRSPMPINWATTQGSRADLDVFENRKISSLCQNLNPYRAARTLVTTLTELSRPLARGSASYYVTATFVVRLFRNVCHLNHCCAKEGIWLDNRTHAHVPPLYATVSGGLPCCAVRRRTGRDERPKIKKKNTSSVTTCRIPFVFLHELRLHFPRPCNPTPKNQMYFRTTSKWRIAEPQSLSFAKTHSVAGHDPCRVLSNTVMSCRSTAPLAVHSKYICSVVWFLHIAAQE